MTHKTQGIVLRSLKYGETSLIVTIFTELFGVQTYMVNGVRSSKQASARANHFQPGIMLDMVVYHNAQKSMQRIKEYKFAFLYTNLLSHVIKHSIALYMVELLYKCLKQPEPHAELFYFCEAALKNLDNANNTVTANFTLFFSLHLPYFFGFKMNDNRDDDNIFLDLKEGHFINHQPLHPYFIAGTDAEMTSLLLKVMQPEELDDILLHHETRRQLLLRYQEYYALHIQDFGQMKTLRVLAEVL
jgi:DNA repair protein RecO (recombination protein O)